MVEHRDYQEDTSGHVVNATGMPGYIVVAPYEVVADRLPPVADAALGVTWQLTRRLEVRGAVHNAFNGRSYDPDVFLNYAPRLENLPNPAEDLRAYVSAVYRY